MNKIIFLVIIILILIIFFYYEHFNVSDYDASELLNNSLQQNIYVDEMMINNTNIIDLFYPVGSLFFCDVETDVDLNKLFPNTEWKFINEGVGRYIMARSNDDKISSDRFSDKKNTEYNLGGQDKLDLVPYHSHSYYRCNERTSGAWNVTAKDNVVLTSTTIQETSGTGRGTPDIFLPKYLNVSVYQRIK